MRFALVCFVVFCVVAAFAQQPTQVEQTEELRIKVQAEQIQARFLINNNNTEAQTDECLLCLLLFDVFDEGLRTNLSTEAIEDIATIVCIDRKIYGGYADVCGGTVKEFTPEILYILTQSYVSPQYICQRLKRCPASPPPAGNNNTDDLPPVLSNYGKPTMVKRQWKPDDPNIGTFIQVTDVHVDAIYEAGTNAGCGKPQCCRASEGPAPNASFAAGKWGDYRCDSNRNILHSLVMAVSAMKPDFLFWTGDNPPHDIWEQSREENLNASKLVADELLQAMGNVPVYAAIGNHESFPTDQFEGPPYDDWLYGSLAEYWTQWLTPEANKTLQYAGYYTQLIAPGLRVIALNTQYCDSSNFWLLLNNTDPGSQLAWLEETLTAAAGNKEKVFTTGHIPICDCVSSYGDLLHRLYDKHSDVIIAHFYGHSHHDEFEVIRDVATDSEAVGIVFVAPSVTPNGGVNPSFRVYNYDRTTFEILDYTQYYFNVTEANLNDGAEWKKSYSLLEEYGMNGTTPADFQNFGVRMFHDNDLFEKYYENFATLYPQPPCDANCQKSYICNALSCTDELVNKCMQSTPVYKMKHLCDSFLE